MARSVALAFLWHFHQPFYGNDLTGEVLLPWVRMHAVKDYTGMALLLERRPEIKATFNFVPSLLRQLRETDGLFQRDAHLRVSSKPAVDLDDIERAYVLGEFFSANREHMINRYPRYAELLALRGEGPDALRTAPKRFTNNDIRDLQVLANLAWFHPLLIAGDEFLEGMVEKERGYAEDEKQRLLRLQVELMPKVIDRYRALAERGQVELTSTPFYHPILPLVADFSSQNEAHPRAPLARGWERLASDAETQVARALDYHQECFGHRPAGMWPAEGAVSQATAAVFARAGVSWIAGDERVLYRSLHGGPTREPDRDRSGKLVRPDHQYQPFRVRTSAGDIACVFRDRHLSDLLGFGYQTRQALSAARHFIGVLQHARRHCERDLPLVPVILDGENAWEHYPGLGVPFLSALYDGVQAASPDVRTVLISEHLEEHPPTRDITRLFAGSWIGADFNIWAGHEEDLAAWEEVFRARRTVRRRQESKDVAAADVRRAWEEIYIAEGSDWYWWYGEEHSSAHDGDFDALFRTHLKNAYFHVGEIPPESLQRPIKRGRRKVVADPPMGFISPRINGARGSFFKWLGAGCFDPRRAGGAMVPGKRVVQRMFYGFDAGRFFVRLVFGEEAPAPADLRAISVQFESPGAVALRFVPAKNGDFHVAMAPPGEREFSGEAAMGEVFEASCPFADLDFAPGQPLAFAVNVALGDGSEERLPVSGVITTVVPTSTFEKEHWNA